MSLPLADLPTTSGEVLLISVLTVALMLICAVPILLIKDRLSAALQRRRHTPGKLATERRAVEQRLRRPDWPFYEAHLQRPAPAALRELYADEDLLLREGCEYSEMDYISTFEPLDREGLVESRAWLGFDAIPFANSDGNLIYLRPGPGVPDIVYITYHDGGDTQELAPDVATFLRHFRQANADHRPG